MTRKLFLITLLVFSVKLFANTPVLSNFRIEDSEKNRVYFDSSEPITGSSAVGFTISLNTISGLTIVPDQTTGHYFTVASAFTFWDNNTIRYEGGSDIADINANALHEFTLTYIENNIPEPEASSYKYVTTSATGGGDGLTEDTAWTLSEAFSRASAGETVWIKAGNYGDQNFQIDLDGTETNPIKLIGYKNSIGDITDNYWDYGVAFSSDEMPTLTGTFSTNNYSRAIFWLSSNYVIMRNFQITKYLNGMSSGPNAHQANSNLIFDRVNGYEFNKPGVWDTYSSAFTFNSDIVGNTKIRFTNGVIMNYEMQGVQIYGDGQCLIDNMKIYNTDNSVKPDYQINVNGDHNIIRNCHIEITGDYYSASTHGIGVRGNDKLLNTYNLIEKSTAININEGFYLRNSGCHYNVIKDCYVGNNGASSRYRGAVYIWGGSNYNIIERLVADDVTVGVGFKDNFEEDVLPFEDFEIGRHNIIRNSIFNNFEYGVTVEEQTSGGDGKLYDNQIINCTFNNGDNLFRFDTNVDVRNLEFINTSFSDINNYSRGVSEGESFTNSNFWNFWGVNGTPPAGTSNSSLEPLFVSPDTGDFHLQPTSPIKDTGKNVTNVRYDVEGIERINDKYSIGAHDDAVPTTGSVSPDVTICIGENAVLVASGGVSYEWSTGETSESISVQPDTTTTYTVTVTDTSNSQTHEVVVTVNDPPTVTLEDDQTICYGEEITLTAEGNGDFLWSTGETTASITITPDVTTTYSVTANNSCSTEASDEIIITVNPEIGLTAGDDVAICTGESITLTAQSNGDFLWSTGETTPSITVTPGDTTTYTVTSTLGACSETDEVIVSVNEQASVDLGNDQTICFGENITLTAVGVGDFLWSTGETTESITVSPSDTTTYTVTANNACATEATDEIIITVNPEIGLIAGDDLEICTGETITLTAQSNGDFLWSTGETTASITVSPSATTTYTVTSTIGTCSESGDVIVTVNDPPSVTLEDDLTICYGETVTLTATGTGNFLWSTGETTESITVSPTDTTTYTIVASNACSDATDEIIVTVNPEIGLSVGNDQVICTGESVTLTATGTGDFLWSTGETTQSITVTPSATTSYSVTANIGTCIENDSILVTVNESPSVDLGADRSICFGDSVTLTASGNGDFLWSTGETTQSITVNPEVTTAYSVIASNSCSSDVTDEIIVNVNPEINLNAGNDVVICTSESVTLTATGSGSFLWSTGETTASITVQPTSDTTYIVTSTLGDCSESDSVRVTVNESPSVTLGADITICYGETVTLTAEGNGDFMWDNGSTARSITVNPTVTTTYSVTATNLCADGDADEITVFVNPLIELDAGNDVTICAGENVTLTATGNGDFLWSTGETTASITVQPNSTRTYLVTSSIGDCTKTDGVVVNVNQAPSVSLGTDLSICAGESVILTASGNGNFLWNTGETTASITVNPTVTTAYSVTASVASCGSDATDEIIVNVSADTSVNAGSDLSICSGDSVTLTATGTGDFLWSTGETTASINVNPTVTTLYTVSATSGTCSQSDDVIVTVNQAPSVTASNDVTIELGQSTVLTADGVGNFKWSTGEIGNSIIVNPDNTETYTVTAFLDEGCSGVDVDEVMVEVIDTSESGVIFSDMSENISVCPQNTVYLSATEGDRYLWSTGEDTRTINISAQETTIYSVKVYNGEESVTYSITVFVKEKCQLVDNQEVLVYPNPSTGIINVRLTGYTNKPNVSVYSVNGVTVYSERIDNSSQSNNVLQRQIDLSRFAKGVYFVRLGDENSSQTKKVLIQ